jgi:hypothetical protein
MCDQPNSYACGTAKARVQQSGGRDCEHPRNPIRVGFWGVIFFARIITAFCTRTDTADTIPITRSLQHLSGERFLLLGQSSSRGRFGSTDLGAKYNAACKESNTMPRVTRATPMMRPNCIRESLFVRCLRVNQDWAKLSMQLGLANLQQCLYVLRECLIPSKAWNMPGLLICDDNPNIRYLLRAFVESRTPFKICREAVHGIWGRREG